MSAINDYSANCDYLKKRIGLSEFNTSIYDLIQSVVDEMKKIDVQSLKLESLNSLKEKENVRPSPENGRSTETRRSTSKSSTARRRKPRSTD